MTTKKKTTPKTTKPKKVASAAPKREVAAEKPVKTGGKFQLLRGYKDILPEDQRYWNKIRHVSEEFAGAYGFARIDVPLLEMSEVFTRTSGQGSDVVQKEMYTFVDPSGEGKISLRPELTAGIVRAYGEHGMQHLPQPLKLFTYGPVFRHDRPQAGRQRQFHQVDYEILGSEHPVADAEVILLTYSFFKELGLSVVMQVNSIGTVESRGKYLKVLTEYFKKHKAELSELDRERLQTNVLRILDSKEPESQQIISVAPQILDYLDEQSKSDFMKVLEYLDDAGVPYSLNPRLVRGLDYYVKTTFEVWLTNEEETRMSSLGGGGRYDGLSQALGYPPVAGVGVGIGVERVILAMKQANVVPADPYAPEVYLTQLGEPARKRALQMIEHLRRSGVRVTEGLAKNGLRPQLEQASKLGVQFALIIGQKEVLDNTIIIRDMESGVQEIIAYEKVIEEVRKRVQQRNKERGVLVDDSVQS